MNTLDEKLKKLEYHPFWITADLINESFIDQQLACFNEGIDLNTEHYRYQAFLQWMDKQTVFTDLQISNFISLISLDTDKLMAGAATMQLLRNPLLNDMQFETLFSFMADFNPGSQSRTLPRLKILRQLKKTQTITPDEFYNYLQTGDSVIHEYLLENHSDKHIEYLTQLANEGANKRIRNIALTKLKRLSRSQPSGRQ